MISTKLQITNLKQALNLNNQNSKLFYFLSSRVRDGFGHFDLVLVICLLFVILSDSCIIKLAMKTQIIDL